MGRVDPAKMAWIIRERQKIEDGKGAFTVAQIAKYAGVTDRRVRQLWARFKETGAVPVPGRPGRPRSACWDACAPLVVSAFAEYRCGSVALGRIIEREWNIHIPHGAVLGIMQERGLSAKAPGRSKRRKWVRYERTYSNSMWHTDYKLLPDGRWLVSYMDDASRFITGFGVFEEATGAHALEVLDRAIGDHGKPASVLTDHGSQFYANEAASRKRGESEFERRMVEKEIQHRLARVNHPQTNGKIERFHGEIKAKLRLFRDMDEFVDWWNNIRPHMSLDWDSLETPARAFVRKMPEDGSEVTDEQNGEKYRAVKSPGGNTAVWVVK